MDAQTTTLIITSLLLKPALMLLLVWLLSLLVRKQSAAFQHFVLALGMIGVLLVPLLAVFLPGIDWHHLPVLGDWALALDEHLLWLNVQLPQVMSLYQWMLVVGIYFFVVFWLVFYALLSAVALYVQTRQAQDVSDSELLELRDQLCEILDIQNPVIVKTSAQVTSPYMWGFLHAVILLPREAVLWDKDKKLSVLMHELGHVARRDWMTSQLVRMTCAVFWFLPPIWWLAGKLYDHAEIACDDLIYRLRDKHLAYAQSLLQFAGGGLPAEGETGLGIHGHSSIYWRITAVLDKRRPRAPVAVESAQYWFLMGLLVLMFMASIQVIPLQPIKPGTSEWIATPLVPEPVAVVEEDEEAFDLTTLKQLSSSLPPSLLTHAHQGGVEEVIVRARPAWDEIATSEKINTETSVMQPNISVQGYLPLEVVIPEYPQSALARGIESRLVVEYTIASDGSIQAPKIISRSSATRVFDKAVISAIRKSRFKPQMFDGQPVSIHGVTEEFIFKLEPSAKRRR